MVDMKHVALLSVNRFKVSRYKKNKIDELFKDPAMMFNYKTTLDAAKF